MSDGIITLVGNVASDVRTIKSERGTAITSFRFAHTPPDRPPDGSLG